MDDTPLVIQQGDTLIFGLVWTDANNQPVNITGARACMQLRPQYFSPTIVLDVDSNNGGIVIDGPAGKLSIRVEADVTAAIQIQSGVYDLQILMLDGTVTTLLRGRWRLVHEVTRCL